MTNFEILLIAVEQLLHVAKSDQLNRPTWINISGAMARDPEVRKYCQISQDRGQFLGIPLHVVRDIEPIYLTARGTIK